MRSRCFFYQSTLLVLTALLALQASAATPQISAGSAHGLVLQSDGTLVAWGNDEGGALGVGRALAVTSPSRVPGLDLGFSPVSDSLSVGAAHNLARLADGTLQSWGGNSDGQLGDGTTTNRPSPAPVPDLGPVLSMASGARHSLAVKEDGTVWAWGANDYGQLGDGTTEQRETPVQVDDLEQITAVAAGRDHSLALDRDGRVWAWGGNTFGQLGRGTSDTEIHATPQQVTGLKDVLAIATHGTHNLALIQLGRVAAWGDNRYGQLGDGRTADSAVPRLARVSGVRAIAAGFHHSLAVTQSGTLWAWGANSEGQLGDGTKSAQPDPVRVDVPGFVTAVSAGWSHALALDEDGGVWAWGRNQEGQLGDGTTSERLSPVPVPGLDPVQILAAGKNSTLAGTGDGAVWAWGDNSMAQLGVVAEISRSLPTAVVGSSEQGADDGGFPALLAGSEVPLIGQEEISGIGSGANHNLAVARDGSLWAWGDNSSGQLGDGGSSVAHSSPVLVPGIDDVTQAAAGLTHSLALTADGGVWSWGGNSLGQLGQGDQRTRTVPEQVQGLSGVVAIASDGNHNLALTEDGTVWAWGDNGYGQLGDGTSTDRSSPVRVVGLANVTAVAAGGYHSLASTADGSLWGWGRNRMGQLGDGTTSDRSRPVLVDGSLGVGVKAFAAGHQHSLGLTLDGALWSWGDNRYGQLGLGVADSDSHPLPTKVAGISAGAVVAAGHRFSLAMREDGTLWAFGDNDSGQLGDGTYADRASPAPIVTADEQELARAPSSGAAGTPFKIYNAKGGQGLVDDELCDRLATVGVKAVDDSYDINVFMGLDGFEESEACGIVYDDEAVYAVWVAANRADGSWYFRGDEGWQLYTDSAFEAPLPAYRDQVDRGQIAGVAIPLIMGRDRYTSDWDGAVFYVGYGTSEADMMQAGRFRPVVTADLDAAPK